MVVVCVSAYVAYYEDAVIFYCVVDVVWGEIVRQFDSFLIYISVFGTRNLTV